MKKTMRLILAGLLASAWFLLAGTLTADARPQPLIVAQAADCNPNYTGTCIPLNVTEADCAGGTGNGPYFVEEKNIRVVGTDVFGLDKDKDGIGCETTDLADDTGSTNTTAAPAVTTTPTTTAGTAVTTAPSAIPATTTPTGMPNTGSESGRQAGFAATLVVGGAVFLYVGTRRAKFNQRFPF